jgi:hypothetical protein
MPKPAEVIIPPWQYPVENFNTSTLEFFNAIEAQLSAKQYPVRMERVDHSESGVLSAKREYLRVSYGRYSFDIGAGAFGKDFFFSSWLVRRLPDNSLMMGCLGLLALPIAYATLTAMAGFLVGFVLFMLLLVAGFAWVINSAQSGSDVVEDAILGMPILGSLYLRYIRPTTYYSEDSRNMFQQSVHRVVVAEVSALLSLAKLPPLTPEQEKPAGPQPSARP